MSDTPEDFDATDEWMLMISPALQALYGGLAAVNLYAYAFRCHHVEHLTITVLLVGLIMSQRATDEWRVTARSWRGAAQSWRRRAEDSR